MDAETFKRRVTVFALLIGLVLVGYGLMSGAEWFMGALQVAQEASHGRMA